MLKRFFRWMTSLPSRHCVLPCNLNSPHILMECRTKSVRYGDIIIRILRASSSWWIRMIETVSTLVGNPSLLSLHLSVTPTLSNETFSNHFACCTAPQPFTTNQALDSRRVTGVTVRCFDHA